MQNFDILKRDLNIVDAHFLEASAGTGKTFAVEHLVIRLLLETSFILEEILIVTFTRKATRELKNRLRTALQQTKAALIAKTSSHDYMLALYEKGEESVKTALKKIDAALVCFDAAQVFTLHGFSHRMLSEFCFESKVGAHLQDPQEHTSLHYKRAVRDFLLHHLTPHAYSAHQLRLVLKKEGGDPFRLMERIVSLLAKETPIPAYPAFHELHKAFNHRLKELSPIDPALFIQDIEKLKGCYKGIKKETLRKQSEIWASILQARECPSPLFETLLDEKEWFFEKMHAQNLKQRASSASLSLSYPGLIDLLRKDIAPLIQEASCPTKILLRLAKNAQEHAALFLKEQECISPDHMLRHFHRALGSKGFADMLRQRYQAVIIDEFQDTDPIQWSIFKHAFFSKAKVFCLVGDPKQSIYAFRNADIYTYLDASQTLGKEKCKSLNTNYRSTPALVHALNQLFFAPKGAGWLKLPQLNYALPLQKVQAGRGETQPLLPHRGAVHFFIAQSKYTSTWPSRSVEEEMLFPFIASEAQAVHQAGHIAWEEIVILVKDRFQAQRLSEYLKKQGIPASFCKGSHITHSPALSAFRECLEGVLSPHDLSKLKKTLAGPFFLWDEYLLRDDFNASRMQQMKIQMQLLQKILLKKGFASFFHALMTQHFPPDERSVEQNILERSVLSFYQDVRKIAEILIEAEMHAGCRGRDFISYLQEIEEQEDEARFELPPPELKGSIALMTIYLSKGLEFHTVFALALASRHSARLNAIVKGNNQLMAFEESDPACLQALEELDAEKMRLLYVALTRAKERVYIPFVIDTDAKQLDNASAAPIELFLASIAKECPSNAELYEEINHLQQENVEAILHTLAEESSLTYSFLTPIKQVSPEILSSNLKPPKPCKTKPPLILPPSESLLSFSSLDLLHNQCFASSSTDLLQNPPSTCGENLLPLGAATGVVVHRLFELIFKRSLHSPWEESKIRNLIALEVEDTPLQAYEQDLFALVFDAFHLFLLPDKTLQLKDIPSSQAYQEFEFLFPCAEHAMMKGFADLVFFYEDKYFLLDWKTNYLGPHPTDYTQEAMQKAMEEHRYFLQASIYTQALKRYVKLFDIRPFEEIFGGAFYIFVRGCSAFHFFPEEVTCYQNM